MFSKKYLIVLICISFNFVTGFVPTDCYQPCSGGNCRYDDCKETVSCPGGLCYFYNCMHPICEGGACTFERCWMPSCKGGACTNINPMEMEEQKPEYVAFPVGQSQQLRGGSQAISVPQTARLEDGRFLPPPPPNRIETNRIGDPEEEARLLMQEQVEAKMLSDLKLKAETGVIKNEEKVQLKYLETRAHSAAMKREWEQHQREVEMAYQEAKQAQAILEEEARIAEQKRLEEEAAAFAAAEKARIEAEERAAQQRKIEEEKRIKAEAEEAALNYQKLLEQNALAEETERLKQEEVQRFANVQQRMQERLEKKAVQSLPILTDMRGDKISTGSQQMMIPQLPKLDFKTNSFLEKHLSSTQHKDITTSSSSSSKEDNENSVFSVINDKGVCVMPMVSFEVAVFALTIFLSDIDFEVVDFLKFTQKFIGMFLSLIGGVSLATPGGELVMLCCVHELNELVLRSWFFLFLFTLCTRAVFETFPEHHERWLRLLQVACILFVADCFVLHQHTCHEPQHDPISDGSGWRTSAMYVWASCIFYLVFRIECFLDIPPTANWNQRFRVRRSGSDSDDGPYTAKGSRFRFPSDNSVDICEVDEDDDVEFGYKSKYK